MVAEWALVPSQDGDTLIAVIEKLLDWRNKTIKHCIESRGAYSQCSEVLGIPSLNGGLRHPLLAIFSHLKMPKALAKKRANHR